MNKRSVRFNRKTKSWELIEQLESEHEAKIASARILLQELEKDETGDRVGFDTYRPS